MPQRDDAKRRRGPREDVRFAESHRLDVVAACRRNGVRRQRQQRQQRIAVRGCGSSGLTRLGGSPQSAVAALARKEYSRRRRHHRRHGGAARNDFGGGRASPPRVVVEPRPRTGPSRHPPHQFGRTRQHRRGHRQEEMLTEVQSRTVDATRSGVAAGRRRGHHLLTLHIEN